MTRIYANLTAALAAVAAFVPLTSSAQPKDAVGEYVNKGNRADSARATLASHKLLAQCSALGKSFAQLFRASRCVE